MRLEILNHDHHVVVALSQRNLLALLHKLEMPGSECALHRGNLTVVAEPDAVHYADRSAGAMRPATEACIAQGFDTTLVLEQVVPA